MNVAFLYSINARVTLQPLSRAASVLMARWDGIRREYFIQYYWDGRQVSEWVREEDLCVE